MPLRKIQLERRFTQKRDQQKGITFLTRRVLSSRPTWDLKKSEIFEPKSNVPGQYLFKCELTFEKTSGLDSTEEKEWTSILADLAKVGAHGTFKGFPWVVQGETARVVIPELTEESSNGNTKGAFDQHFTTLEEVKAKILPSISDLLTYPEALKENEHFKDIYNRDAQIRILLSAIKSFLESDGERRSHSVLYGMPACGKTQIMLALTQYIGQDAFVRLDGTSTTPAGIYKTYFEQFDQRPEPPFVILEEAEKTSEESLRVWLGVMDERGELRKVNFKEQNVRNLKVLCLATANDKNKFDLMMGGEIGKPGALSSRFAHQLYCQRPDEAIMRMILKRDILAKGGELAWIEPIMELAKHLNTNDPRKVLSFIDGGDRLMTGDYQRDILAVYTNLDEVLN